MTSETWYVHGCIYDSIENNYDVSTRGPFPDIQTAFDFKMIVSKLYDFVEVNQNSFLKMPDLV